MENNAEVILLSIAKAREAETTVACKEGAESVIEHEAGLCLFLGGEST